MTGVIMLRRDDGITMLGDGANFKSVADFTVTGFASKLLKMPHIPAILGLVGFSSLRLFLEHYRLQHWHTFDVMVDRFRDDVSEELGRCMVKFGPNGRYRANLMFGGYSTKRERWETYTLEADSNRDEWEEGVGGLLPAPQLLIFPMPDEEPLRQFGFTPPDLQIPDDRECLIRLIKAQRATPQYMGRIGDVVGEEAVGYTIGGFIERTMLGRSAVISEILWRWPDKAGEMIKITDEGEAVQA